MNERLYLMGDFIVIRKELERKWTSENLRMEELKALDEFIIESELIDIPLYPWLKINLI